jgi:hypothetical protein
MDAVLLKYLVRLVHTAAAAFVVGGAAVLWAQSVRVGLASQHASEPESWLPASASPLGASGNGDRSSTIAAGSARPFGAAVVRYEQGFWAAVGLLTMTGIGNLAVFGAALPGGQTDWGARLLTKLAAVAVLVVFSAYRTLVVARGAGGSGPACRLLAALYGATAFLSLVVLGLAVSLAHP